MVSEGVICSPLIRCGPPVALFTVANGTFSTLLPVPIDMVSSITLKASFDEFAFRWTYRGVHLLSHGKAVASSINELASLAMCLTLDTGQLIIIRNHQTISTYHASLSNIKS